MSGDVISATWADMLAPDPQPFTHSESEALDATGRILGLLWADTNPDEWDEIVQHVHAIQGVVLRRPAKRHAPSV